MITQEIFLSSLYKVLDEDASWATESYTKSPVGHGDGGFESPRTVVVLLALIFDALSVPDGRLLPLTHEIGDNRWSWSTWHSPKQSRGQKAPGTKVTNDPDTSTYCRVAGCTGGSGGRELCDTERQDWHGAQDGPCHEFTEHYFPP